VNVGALQRDVNDPKPLAQRRRDRGLAQRLVHRASPQATDLRRDPHHDVQRVIRLELRPRLVPFPGTRAPGLPSSTAPLAAPPEQLLLTSPLRLSLRPRRPHALIVTTRAYPVNDWALIIAIHVCRLSIGECRSKTYQSKDTCTEKETFQQVSTPADSALIARPSRQPQAMHR
jgi:hypothetical protein